MKEKIISGYLGDFKFCEDGEKRWVEMPALKLEDGSDVEHLDKDLDQIYRHGFGGVRSDKPDGYDRNGMCYECGAKSGEHGPECNYDSRLIEEQVAIQLYQEKTYGIKSE
jgi:hypothetical protein